MKKLIISLLFFSSAIFADTIPVTLENYIRAESDLAFHKMLLLSKNVNALHHMTISPSTEYDLKMDQVVVRMNLDTAYSGAILDISEGATISLPEIDERYMSLMIVDNDHYVSQIITEPGTHNISADTDHISALIRFEINLNDPADIAKVRQFQESIKIDAKSSRPFNFPDYDIESIMALRNKLAVQAAEYGALTKEAMGPRGKVDHQQHLLATAAGWGLLPSTHAHYMMSDFMPGDGCYAATYDVPPFADSGFFSITVYDRNGWLAHNKSLLNKYNIEFNQDGTFTAHYGDCGEVSNNIKTTDGWNYVLRVYEPGDLSRYKLPELKKLN